MSSSPAPPTPPVSPPAAPFRRWPGRGPQPYWAYDALFVSSRWTGGLVESSHAATDRAIRPSRGGPAGRLIPATTPSSIRERLRLLKHLLLPTDDAEAQAALLAWAHTNSWIPALGILRGGARRARWMAHPKAPGWAWRQGFLQVFSGPFTLKRQVAELLLQAPLSAQSQQRHWCEPIQSDPNGASRWRDGLWELGQALTEFDLSPRPLSVGRLDPQMLRSLLDLQWPASQYWALLCLLAEDPRPWPKEHWGDVLQRAEQLRPDATQGGVAQVAYEHASSALAARLALRADLDAHTVARVEEMLSTLPTVQVQPRIAHVLSETDDLNWTGLGARCEGLLRLAGGATGERLHHAVLLETWLVAELRGGPERPPQDRAPIWRSLQAAPRWLLTVAEAVRDDPVLAEEAATAIRALSPQSLRPLLVSPSQELRLLAVRALGQRAADPSPGPLAPLPVPAPPAQNVAMPTDPVSTIEPSLAPTRARRV